MPPSDPDSFISPVFDPSEHGAFSSGSRQRAQEPADESAAPCLLQKVLFTPEPGIAALQKALPARNKPPWNKNLFAVLNDVFFKQAADNLPSGFKV